jgi:hypothetical protein
MKAFIRALALSCLLSSAYADESTMDKLKEALQQSGEKIQEIAKSIQDYDWKGTVEDAVYVGPAFVTGATFNGQSRFAVVKPDEAISCEITVDVDENRMKDLKFRGLLFGIKDVGPQALISIEAGKKTEKFTLKAPSETGVYQVRFRPVVSLNMNNAQNDWVDAEKNQPSLKSTVGIIIVKSSEKK